MKRKIATIIVFIISALVMLMAMNQSFINRIKQDRYFAHLDVDSTLKKTLYYRIFVRSDRWRYGDLYGLCYLPQYRFTLEPFKKYNLPPTPATKTNRILYIIGDSFLADKTLNHAFNSFDNVIFFDRRFAFGPISLDSSKQNFLMLEFAERNLNGFDQNQTAEVKWSQNELKARNSYNPKYVSPFSKSNFPFTLLARLNNIIFNKDLSRNLELILFDDHLFTPVKELKSTLNYNLFGRVANEVSVSTDKKRLFLNITVDTTDLHSAFRVIPNKEIDTTVAHLAAARNYYTSIGFKNVFLSLIPNPVSIYDYKRMPYNHLLERVEERSTIPVISIFRTYRTSNQNLYYKSDAHWNPAGLNAWVQQANKYLHSYNYGR